MTSRHQYYKQIPAILKYIPGIHSWLTSRTGWMKWRAVWRENLNWMRTEWDWMIEPGKWLPSFFSSVRLRGCQRILHKSTRRLLFNDDKTLTSLLHLGRLIVTTRKQMILYKESLSFDHLANENVACMAKGIQIWRQFNYKEGGGTCLPLHSPFSLVCIWWLFCHLS